LSIVFVRFRAASCCLDGLSVTKFNIAGQRGRQHLRQRSLAEPCRTTLIATLRAGLSRVVVNNGWQTASLHGRRSKTAGLHERMRFQFPARGLLRFLGGLKPAWALTLHSTLSQPATMRQGAGRLHVPPAEQAALDARFGHAVSYVDE
jgi:hypothetical protein